jgi:hypothetical protein
VLYLVWPSWDMTVRGPYLFISPARIHNYLPPHTVIIRTYQLYIFNHQPPFPPPLPQLGPGTIILLWVANLHIFCTFSCNRHRPPPRLNSKYFSCQRPIHTGPPPRFPRFVFLNGWRDDLEWLKWIGLDSQTSVSIGSVIFLIFLFAYSKYNCSHTFSAATQKTILFCRILKTCGCTVRPFSYDL